MSEFISLSRSGHLDADAITSTEPVVSVTEWENAIEVEFAFPGFWLGDPEPGHDRDGDGSIVSTTRMDPGAYPEAMAHPRSRRGRAARKRQRRMARVEHDLDTDQWAALCEAWGGCAYCGATDVALQRDCVLALSRGGRYTLANIVPACASCNASKCNSEVTGWMRRKRLDERSFLVRHHEIERTLAERFAAPVDR